MNQVMIVFVGLYMMQVGTSSIGPIGTTRGLFSRTIGGQQGTTQGLPTRSVLTDAQINSIPHLSQKRTKLKVIKARLLQRPVGQQILRKIDRRTMSRRSIKLENKQLRVEGVIVKVEKIKGLPPPRNSWPNNVQYVKLCTTIKVPIIKPIHHIQKTKTKVVKVIRWVTKYRLKKTCNIKKIPQRVRNSLGRRQGNGLERTLENGWQTLESDFGFL